MERNKRIEEELFPFYALDALTVEERAEVEQYVAGSPEAELRLEELILAAVDLGESTAPITPSPAVKAGLMARIEADNPAVAPQQPGKMPVRTGPAPARRRWWAWMPAVGFAAAFVALLIAGGYIYSLNRQINGLESKVQALEETVAGFQDNLGQLQVQNDQLREQLQARDDQLAAYLSPGAITLALGDMTGNHPDAVGAFTLNPNSGAATLSVQNLPILNETQTYQAWLIVDGTPISAGTFGVNDDGAASHPISGASPGSFDAVGVSIEPAGGSEQPTADQIILLAGFSS